LLSTLLIASIIIWLSSFADQLKLVYAIVIVRTGI